MDEFPQSGRLVGIDFGEVRIGLAICDEGRRLASPYAVYTRRGDKQDADYFRRLVDREKVAGFVIGLPIHADAQESQSSMQARRFGKWLREVTGLPVCYVDERYTTQQAESMMRQGRLTIAERKKRRDMIAAQIILNTYLESPAIVNREPEPLDDTDPFFVF